MDLEEYVNNLERFDKGLEGRGFPALILPAAGKLYATMKSRTGGSGAPGYFDGTVEKKQTFKPSPLPEGRATGARARAEGRQKARELEMKVEQDKVVLGLTQKGGNKRKYQATAQEIDAYTKDVELASEELTVKLLKGQ